MAHATQTLLVLWACVLSAVYRPAYKDWIEGSWEAVIANAFGANYIVWFSLISATFALRFIKLDRFLIILIPALFLMVYPSATLSWLAASLIAFILFLKTNGNMAALLFFAACIREPVTALCMKIFAGNILSFDAVLTNAMLVLMGKTALLQSNIVVLESGTPLLILTGCSVFANLSYISLLWFSVHVFYNYKINGLSWSILALTMVITLASNSLRLALMTGSEQAYVFYHDGLGSQLFEWGLMALVLVIVMAGGRYGKRA